MNNKKEYKNPNIENLSFEADLSFLASTGTGGIPAWEDDGSGEITL